MVNDTCILADGTIRSRDGTARVVATIARMIVKQIANRSSIIGELKCRITSSSIH